MKPMICLLLLYKLRIESGKALTNCWEIRRSPAPSGKSYQTTQIGHRFYEKTLRTNFKKSQIVGDYVICRIFQIHTKPSNLPISNLQTSYLSNLISRIYGLYTTGSIGISFYPRRFCVPAGR
jgi:hypothetical protein